MKQKCFLLLIIIVSMVLFINMSGCSNTSVDQKRITDQPDQSTRTEQIEQPEVDDIELGQAELGSYEILKHLSTENFEDLDNLTEGILPLLQNLDDAISYDKAQKLGFALEDSQYAIFNEAWIWCRSAQLLIDENKYILYIYCTPDSPVTAIQLKRPGSDEYEVTYYNDENLYDYIKHSRDYENVIDKAAYEKYEEYVLESVKEVYDIISRESDGVKGLMLTRFEEIWHGNRSDGSKIMLFRFDYALDVDLSIYRGAGGEYLDSDCRIEGSNGMYGQLIVESENDEIVKTQILAYDELIFPDMQNDEETCQMIEQLMSE